MLKQTVQFEDFDGTNKTKTLYFNLSTNDVFDNSDLQEELERVRAELFGDGQDPERELTIAEKTKFVDVVKRIMKISYGVQKEVDGDLIFDKSDATWDHFTRTAYYEAFLFSLFQDEVRLLKFLKEIFPKDVQKAMEADEGQLTLPVAPDATVTAGDPVDSDPNWVKEKRYPTNSELMHMDKSEVLMAMKARTEGWYGAAE